MSSPSNLRPTRLDIDLGALQRNFSKIRDRVAPHRVWCVVKANAYGHGAPEVAASLQRAGATAFAVATVDEGIELRDAGVTGDVLVMAGIAPVGEPAARAAAERRLAVAVWSVDEARALAAAVRGVSAAPLVVHVKVDTGMGRLGVLCDAGPTDAVAAIVEIGATDGLSIDGVFSNLAAAGAPPGDAGHDHTGSQIERFRALCDALTDAGVAPPHRHLSNSAGLANHPRSWAAGTANGVRPGLALYGAGPPADVEPVMSWRSAIAAVRQVPAGWPLGYGAQRRAERDCTVAVVPVGYHDGWPRSLGDRAEVLVAGRRAKVVGAISMDLTLIDITGIHDARTGDPVVLLGSDGQPSSSPITADEIAEWAGTISHEILSRIGDRVPRRFSDAMP